MAAIVETETQKRIRWWWETQSGILKQLIHHVPGATIRRYDEVVMFGAYLEVDLGDQIVDIEIDDVTTMEEFLENRVVEITIHDKIDGEDALGRHKNGYLETIEDAEVMLNLMKEGKMDDALGMLERLVTW